MNESAEMATSAGALRDKLAVLGNESYTAETCERYAEMKKTGSFGPVAIPAHE